MQGDQKIGKIAQILRKSSQNSHRQAQKCKIINIKAQFESTVHLQQTTFETLKYLQQTVFWNCFF